MHIYHTGLSTAMTTAIASITSMNVGNPVDTYLIPPRFLLVVEDETTAEVYRDLCHRQMSSHESTHLYVHTRLRLNYSPSDLMKYIH